MFIEDAEHIMGKVDKIELAGGSFENKICMEYLRLINKSYHESEEFLYNKDFHNAIESLKNAYKKTAEMKETSCNEFTELLQTTILNSLENIQKELENMSTGLFKTRRYECIRLELAMFLAEKRRNIEADELPY